MALVVIYSGVITGAKITEYLLEKSRIVTHAADERNYHVFYEMLKGLRPEEKERYGLTAADNYFYLNQVKKEKKKKLVFLLSLAALEMERLC